MQYPELGDKKHCLKLAMKIETNLETIASIGKQREEENWKFRSYLKDVRGVNLDAIVQQLYAEVSSHIDCTQCANCCKVVYPILDEEDVVALSSHLNGSVEEFITKHLVVSDEEENAFKFNAVPCPFLVENKCAHYASRPKVCKSYPHLQKNSFTLRLMGVIGNYSICPIVFNVYERLKKEVWNRPVVRKYHR